MQFAKEDHPGGSHPIHRVAGRDATSIFQPIHPPGTIENGLDPERYLGNVDPLTLPKVAAPKVEEGEKERKIDLAEIIGIPDFDVGAVPLTTPHLPLPTVPGSSSTECHLYMRARDICRKCHG